jgi:UDP:flavonoid glycosyltransferase YjiC (YdhE family)
VSGRADSIDGARRPRLRLFLAAFGDPGHAFPMLALGARLVQRGHEVILETWERWREYVEGAGMGFVAAPEYPVFPTPERPIKPYEAVLYAAPLTRRALAETRPDAVVHDILTLAPALAAELEGLAAATLVPHVYPVTAAGLPPYALGARLPRTVAGRAAWRALARPVRRGVERGRLELNQTRIRLGLEPLARPHGGISDQLTLVGTLPQLEYPRAWPPHVHVVGPLAWEPPYHGVSPPPGEDPLVLVAPSTAHDPDHRLLRAALSALGGERVRVLAATNRRPPRTAVATPANARLVEWVSYSRTMPACAAVITHAGHGTLVRALTAGCPVVAVPHVGDMAENAARADWAGVAVRLPWRLLSPTSLRLAVRRALSEPGLARRAAEIARWAAAHDGATQAAELVEAFALSRRSAARSTAQDLGPLAE